MKILWDANTEGGAAALSVEDTTPETEGTMEEETIVESKSAKPTLKGFGLGQR
jgi:hypothetical protein